MSLNPSTCCDFRVAPLYSREPEIHAFSRPARTFTGDFYFVDHDARGRLWFALGDVAGKGLPAAVYMAMIDEHLEHLIGGPAADMSAADVVRSLETALRPHFPRNRFATAVVGVSDPGGELEIVNAGHCEPMLVRGNHVEIISSHGPVIGIHPDPHWTSSTFEPEPGDLLVVYSDGVLETRDREEFEFGLCRISRELAAVSGVSAREVGRRLLAAVDRYRSGEQEDDVSVMAMRW